MDTSIPDKAVTEATRVFSNVVYGDGAWDEIFLDSTRANLYAKTREVLAAALPHLPSSLDTETAESVVGEFPAVDEFEGFFIANDDGYPDLRYSASDDGNDEGEHVRFADAGTSLADLVQAAREYAASLRGRA